jgi:hypothetical protein
MSDEMKITGEQAEKIYVMCDEISYKGETLYDLIFQKKDLVDDMIKLPQERRTECYNELMEIRNQEFDSVKWNKFVNKYPELMRSTNDYEYKIVKFLRMNATLTKKLAKLCTGSDVKEIDRAVEVCQKYIRFLASDSELSVPENQ